MTKPVLFIDVDGVLNPDRRSSGRRPDGYVTHRMRPSGWNHPRQRPLNVWLNPEHGAQLQALPFELVWATTWEAEANEWIGPHVGLPELPVVRFTDRLRYRPDHVHWKTPDLVRYAGCRDFAWLDDEITRHDNAYVNANHVARALLLQVSAFVGLNEDHLSTLKVWAAGLI